MTRVAFLGLGRMGSRMAAHLPPAGFDLVVYNRTGDTARAFAARHGGEVAESPAAAAAGADVVISMLADGDVLADVYTRPAGVLETLRRGAVGVDMGTSGPDAVSAVRDRVVAAGADLVDAPVSGSTPAAEAGTLQIMVGGTDAAVAVATPILDALGTAVRVGPPGAGATLKLAVNSLLLGLNQALAEAVILAEAAGVPAATALDVIAAGAAGAPMIAYRRPQYLDPDGAPVSFTLELARKDLRLALAQAAATGVAMEQAERTVEIVSRLVESGDADRDLGFAVEAVRRGRRVGRAQPGAPEDLLS